MSKKKLKVEKPVVSEPEIEEEPVKEEVKVEAVKSVRKPVDYKKTLHMGKDRFGNPRSQRDFEGALRSLLNADESYEAWQAWSSGGTVTLLLKK